MLSQPLHLEQVHEPGTGSGIEIETVFVAGASAAVAVIAVAAEPKVVDVVAEKEQGGMVVAIEGADAYDGGHEVYHVEENHGRSSRDASAGLEDLKDVVQNAAPEVIVLEFEELGVLEAYVDRDVRMVCSQVAVAYESLPQLAQRPYPLYLGPSPFLGPSLYRALFRASRNDGKRVWMGRVLYHDLGDVFLV